MNDEFYIDRSLRLASKARGRTSPNPMVGAILVKNGEIVSEDYHRRPGSPHAEALVIEKAGEKAHGASLYVNLEPCCHLEKRTPPCTRAIINAGIKEVIIGMLDPNPRVSGKGIKELEKVGIEVRSGILESKSRTLNEFYIKNITTGKPFVILKTAMTLDGKIATPDGESKWITGELARKMVHRTRSSVDAILTAIGTVKADNPSMTSRIRGGRNPKKIVIDPYLEIPEDAKVLQGPQETIIVTKVSAMKQQKRHLVAKKEKLLSRGVHFIEYKGKKASLVWLLDQFGKRGITSILIEAGSSLNAYALNEGVVDKVMFFIAPRIMGGVKSFPAVGGETMKRLDDICSVRDLKIRKIGDDLLVEGYVSSG
jgi:diaminohydroxyphosphoribosylaminopyrimidine deaminase/5-amino-6-(5-phosphoribosylamino)uracil reductase